MHDPADVLKQYWGYSTFRPLQREIVESVLNGKDTLALLPTGGGKSICFQVPGLCMEGITIVISPLIALMNDQVSNLTKRGIKAYAVTSGMHRREIDIVLDNCVYGDVKFLYVSPERLATEMFRLRLPKMKVNLIAVDEAHCISQWGYDFRPSYLEIAKIRELVPKVPVLALTASATDDVVNDIQERLEFPVKNVLKKSFERTNLAYLCLKEENKYSRMIRICERSPGTGLIYVRNRKRTKEISEFLSRNGISSEYYHAGLPAEERMNRQARWINNQTRVIVCTNAFGMGIDKPDVRFVIHIDLPDSPEAYFQEAGRAGRDEKKAFAVILWDDNDLKDLKDSVERNFPPLNEVRKVYQALGNFLRLATGGGEGQTFEIDMAAFSKNFELPPALIYSSLKLLEREGYLALSESFSESSRLMFTIDFQELYNFQVFNKDLDPLIKTILRNFPGAFSNPVKFRESELARSLNVSVQKVISQLNAMAKKEVLSYFPKTELPLITFTRERVDAKRINFSPETFTERKKNVELRMQAMYDYVTNDSECRSRMLLYYFGERSAARCNICDVCLSEKKSKPVMDNNSLKEHLLERIRNNSIPYTELLEQYNEEQRPAVIERIRWMLDQKLIELRPDQTLASIEKS